MQTRLQVEPPTPLAFPGAWTTRGPRGGSRTRPQPDTCGQSAHDLRWRIVRSGTIGSGRHTTTDEDSDDEAADEALVLPPPFLTTDSPRESFDGA